MTIPVYMIGKNSSTEDWLDWVHNSLVEDGSWEWHHATQLVDSRFCNAGLGDLLWHNEKQLHFDEYFEYHKQRGSIPKLIDL